MNFNYSPEFEKDVKALSKKIRTLKNDLERVKPRVAALYTLVEGTDLDEFRKLFFSSKKAAIITSIESCEVIKMRLDTDTDTARGKLRLVFIAVVNKNDIIFVELYAKNEKSREDPKRYKKYL